jgi:hypothetical protein
VTLYQIWPAASGPGSASPDVSGENLGTELYVTTTGLSAVGLRFWRADTSITGPIVGRLYAVTDATTGTAVPGTDVTWTVSGTGWLSAAFAAPVPLTANQRYRAVGNFPANYSATSHYWDSGDGAAGLTNGPLVAPNTGAATGGDQGSFVGGGSLAFPVNSFNSTAYWVDVDVRSGQTIAVGQATETDTAGHNAAAKTRALGQATATETGRPVTVTKLRTVGQASTTDTATALTRRKIRTVGQATTTSTALPVTVPTDTSPTGYPDIERVLCDHFADLGTCGTRTPGDLQGELPFIRIRRVGGIDDQVTDRARVDVEVFTASRADGEVAAEHIRQRLSVRGPLYVTSGGRLVVVDRTLLLSGPVELAWPDPVIRMFHASYQLECRRPWPP